jgi:hypothetical protein
MRPTAVAMLLLIPLALLAGCGGKSKEEKAMANVCSARADIKKQVDQLQGLTLTTATLVQVQDSLKAIGDDLSTIADNQGDLSKNRRNDVKAANDAFKAQIKTIGDTIGSSLSIENAKTQLSSALGQLGATYSSAFSKIDCSSS